MEDYGSVISLVSHGNTSLPGYAVSVCLPIPSSLLHLHSAHLAQAGIAFALGKSLLQCNLAAAVCRACLGRGGMSEKGRTLKWCPVALFSDNVDFAEHSSAQCQGTDELPRCCTVLMKYQLSPRPQVPHLPWCNLRWKKPWCCSVRQYDRWLNALSCFTEGRNKFIIRATGNPTA